VGIVKFEVSPGGKVAGKVLNAIKPISYNEVSPVSPVTTDNANG
jgi:hypothetical protein